ncbi:hypothetical protein [Seonamhaeicola sp. S2-3]|nr:hypothetical protein [Seonamhaeicola sp. S2-3]
MESNNLTYTGGDIRRLGERIVQNKGTIGSKDLLNTTPKNSEYE